MSKRTRFVFLLIGIACLAAAIWITVNIRNGSLTSTDRTVEVELIPGRGS